MTGVQRIRAAFEAAASDNRAALIPYLTPGFPDIDTFMRDARGVLEHADLLELGIPFSDPLGDGPTIQASSQRVLEQGMNTAQVFSIAAELADAGKPIMLMTYYNPIICHQGGEEGFVAAAAAAGISGLILPDLPPEEAFNLRRLAADQGLATVFLAAPTSTDERLRLIGEASTGFIYVVSLTGVTGERSRVSSDLGGLVSRLRNATRLPLAVGFGVSGPETAHEVAGIADGVVVGSAFIKRQAEGSDISGFAAALASACMHEEALPG